LKENYPSGNLANLLNLNASEEIFIEESKTFSYDDPWTDEYRLAIMKDQEILEKSLESSIESPSAFQSEPKQMEILELCLSEIDPIENCSENEDLKCLEVSFHSMSHECEFHLPSLVMARSFARSSCIF
jgi:hypothetical protein